jgi:hypothetical protein
MSANQAGRGVGVGYAELLQQVQAAAALDREVAELEALRQRLPREFGALMA